MEESLLKFFFTFRKIFHYYRGESSYKWLKTYIFAATEKSFDTGIKVPENKCYHSGEDPSPQGMWHMSSCRKEAHVAISVPHNLYLDPYYRNKIEGMNPDKLKHPYSEELEPVSV